MAAMAVAVMGLMLGSVRIQAAQADPAALRNWQELRFGMFIHWGPVALTGHEIGWSRGSQTPVEVYDNLYKQFNPTEFDADAWAQVAQEAGMRYVVLTTKHHDGFCLWDSAATDYDIMATPFGCDVVKELSQACRRHGLEFGTYYSVCDWHHPAFPLGSPGGRSKKSNPDLAAYDAYLQQQVTELVTNYGPLLTMWFDVPQVYGEDLGVPMVDKLRALQPNIVINNRAYSKDGEGSGLSHQLPVGDYDTPEQRVGAFSRDRPWETCMTICQQWAWKPDDTMKSLKDCVQILLHTIGGDGNLLLNVGPMPDGRIEPRQVERLREMGEWVKKHQQGIYGTRGGPFKPGQWGASTCIENRIYLFITKWPSEGSLRLPAVPATVKAAVVQSGGTVTINQTLNAIEVDVPQDDRDAIATVIELTIDGDAFEIKPVDVPPYKSHSVAYGKGATASNVYHNSGQYAAGMAFDDDPETRWATDSGTTDAWLEVDLAEEATVNRALIDERDWNRVRKFELQYKVDSRWETACVGTTIGTDKELNFDPAMSRYFRLHVLEGEAPTIWEVQLFEARSSASNKE